MELVLGDILFRHLTPYDRLIEGRFEIRQMVEKAYGLPSDVWIEADGADLKQVLEVAQAHAQEGLIEVATDIGAYILPEGDLITEQLQEFGAHQRGDLNALLSILRADDVVLDIGAHVGTFAIPIAQELGPHGYVVAVEASLDTFRLLEHNIMQNKVNDRVEGHRLLVGGPDSLPRSPVVLMNNTGGTWFRAASAADPQAMTPVALDSWNEQRRERLDPTVIKIDVEGAELEVLRGAEYTVAATRPVLMVEVSHTQLDRHGVSVPELDRWFTKHDYLLYVSTGTRNTRERDYRLDPLQSLMDHEATVFDVIAVPRESNRIPKVAR